MGKSLKNLIVFVFIAGVTAVMGIFAAAADEETPIMVFVDGSRVEFDVQPIMEHDRTLVPVRFIFEALGAAVTWDGTNQTVTAVKGDDVIEMTVDNTVMRKNGKEIQMDVPARLINDRTMVPVRAVSQGMDAEVNWDGENRKVVIIQKQKTPSPTVTPAPVSTPSPSPAVTAAPSGKPDEKKYALDELSDADMRRLKAAYKTIRYDFEQRVLRDAALEENTEFLENIDEQNLDAEDFVRALWNQQVISKIIEIQMDSDADYVKQENTKPLSDGYLKIAKEAGMDANSQFSFSFVLMDDGSTMMLLSFKNTDIAQSCVYIGIIVQEKQYIRYFMGQTDVFDDGSLFVVQMTKEENETHSITDHEKKNFIKAVQKALDKEKNL